MTIPRVLESGIAALVAAVAVAVISWRAGWDVAGCAASSFLAVFLVTLWRNRTSTIHHRSSRKR